MDASLEWMRTGWRELLAWLAPTNCLGCGQPPLRLCARCATQLQPQLRRVTRTLPGHHPLVALAALPYDGVARAVLIELKRHGAHTLARQLAEAVAALAAADPAAVSADLIVVPPSRRDAWRRRGFTPIAVLASAAGLRTVSPFRVGNRVRDQRELGQAARAANLHGAFTLRPSWARALPGKRVILLDDVLTTGATLTELRRACLAAGAEVISAWALTETARRGSA